jgi:hypothetical protein
MSASLSDVRESDAHMTAFFEEMQREVLLTVETSPL